MIIRNYNPPITDKDFRRIITYCLLEGLQPTLVHGKGSYEVELYYNHPCECKRMVARMGMYYTIKKASSRVDELYAIYETVQKELGL